jgi:Flp pilus assembly protein TadG
MVGMAQDRIGGGILSRLARDKRGNTLAIMAASLVPLAAFSGAAIDMARLYVVKVRLQQSCDAGVLAGRKFMDNTSTSTTLDANATAQANAFFKNNFATGWFNTNTVSFTPVKTSDSQVSGTASATVPMTIMKMFGFQNQVINVSCMARYDLADTDVMFVLDVTGSMACLPSDDPVAGCNPSVQSYTQADGTTGYYEVEKTGSKLQAVRDAVKSFYETLVKNTDTTTHIRYGFVPYNSSVNVGAAVYTLSPAYFTSSWNYQSRSPTVTNDGGKTQTKTVSGQSACNSLSYSQTTYDSSGTSTSATSRYYTTTSNSGWPLYLTTTNKLCDVTTTTYTLTWTYQQVSYPTTAFLATINGGSITDPSKMDGSTTAWLGCIEERTTTAGLSSTSSYDISNLPADLDPDVIPSSDANRWHPYWPAVVYGRNFGGSWVYSKKTNVSNVAGDTYVTPDNSNNTPAEPNMNGYSMQHNGYAPCPQAAKPLATMSEDDVNAYMATLRPHGGTYHDIGMIWGTRMISPNGIFKDSTKAWTGRPDPQRVIVFLTDGAMSPDARSYGAYGIEYFDGRVTGGWSGNSSALTNLADYHNARFLTECAKAKSENISVWVVAVGQSLTDPMKQCASNTSQALYAGSGADLTTAFQTIAKQVAMLRISQ